VSRARAIAGAASRAGRGRDQNEDSHVVDPVGAVFLVADGMGGHAAGEVASALAVARVHESWTAAEARRRIEAYAARPEAEERRALFETVRDGVIDAHVAIADEAERDHTRHGMGTTLTGMLVAGGEAVFAHAGDSRAYLVRGGAAQQLSEDHSIRARLRASGIEPQSDRIWRGVLTNALGVGDVTRVARFAVAAAAGDRFLLCTDGVHDLVRAEADLAAAVTAASTPELAAAALVDLAVERGAHDDATAVVVEIQAGGNAEQSASDAAAIERCALFEALSGPERLRALRIVTPRSLSPGARLAPLLDGDRATYVLLDGAATLVGGDRVGPGALVYPDGLLEGTGAPRGSAVAATEGRVLAIHRADFLELTEEEPDLGVKLYAALARLMMR
jgi:serine/threonine protein phosphatase PrpC